MEAVKKPWESKTLIVNAILAILAVAYPQALEFVTGNAEFLIIAINLVLRLVTKKKIQLT